ncbi:iron-containing alcohol dehydrogenase [Paracoccus sp. (in: a-proteobacteria)]|uniref:iron-containing alcohol dehydrogenase n=1 Tax=Paracoccus sp. TaxID=267 RepID=UPI003A898995
MSLINYVTRVQFGYDKIKTLGKEAAMAGIDRPLIVTDKGVRQLGMLEQVIDALGTRPVGIFDGTPGNPDEAAVRTASDLFGDARADGIIAIGGGSSLDLAKGVAVLAAHGGALRDYAAIEGGMDRITPATFPTIAIPTTAGTGSEVGRGAILILEDGRKVGLLSPHLVPRAAIVDPGLTLSLPAALTAATGMDAVSHCIETFLSPLFNPPADGIALEGLRQAWASIGTATENGADRQARARMAMAATMGAMAFQKGLGCVHSLSHALGGLDPRLHHGTLNAVFMPAVLAFNRDAESVASEDKFARLAQAMEIGGADEVIPAIRHKTRDIGLPERLSDLGVTRDLFDRIATGALADHSHRTNPKEASRQDYLDMLEASF